MNSPESLPPDLQQKCPNCGTMAPRDYALCPRCGMALSAPSKTIYGCAIWLFQGFLGLLALAFGASGACFAFFGLNEGTLFLMGAALLTLATLCVWGIIRIAKSRK